jgi:hypothetical protein
MKIGADWAPRVGAAEVKGTTISMRIARSVTGLAATASVLALVFGMTRGVGPGARRVSAAADRRRARKASTTGEGLIGSGSPNSGTDIVTEAPH